MKLVKEGSVDFDHKVFTVEVTGREIVHIYAGLMNLGGGDFNNSIARLKYNGAQMVDTDEIDINSWFKLITGEDK